MSHTSGPWEAKRLIDRDGKPYSTYYIAHIDIGPCMVWAPPGNVEQEANARLIAAAPDLLAACKRLMLAQNEDVVAVIQAMGMVRAAIAKAEGGNPK